VALLQADLLEGVSGPFDVVVSNPPYVGRQERGTLMPEVRDHEPALALFAGPEGLDLISRLIAQAADRLAPGGWLLMEIAAARASATVTKIRSAGIWQEVSVRDDYSGLPRVIRMRLGAGSFTLMPKASSPC
jgi:release factor glutamine methyltransferase